MMRTAETTNWFHSNKYSADKACEHCEGVVRHEEWCITLNPVVAYAFEAVLDCSKLTLEDQLILHALGAAWIRNDCHGACSMRDR